MRRAVERIADRWTVVLALVAAAMLAAPLTGAAPPAKPAPPKQPTVGDLITLKFDLAPDESLRLDHTDRYEVVSQLGGTVVIRSFQPGKFTVVGKIRSPKGERTEKKDVTIASVLAPKDNLKPAPLEPPWPLPANHAATVALVIAAVAAVGAWAAVVWMARRMPVEEAPAVFSVSALEEFQRGLERVRRMPHGDARLIALSEITRSFLSRIEPPLGRELTTTEVADVLRARMVPEPTRATVREILDEGDFAKFSGWGGRDERFDDVASHASGVVELAGTAGTAG